MELTVGNETKFMFVTVSGKAEDSSKIQMLSFVKMVEIIGNTQRTKWVSTEDAVSLANKKSVFIVENGQLFERLASAESIVLSPGVILKCHIKMVQNGQESLSETPIFANLTVTSTGLVEEEKNQIMRLINDNGGTYSGSFSSKQTNIVITRPSERHSTKFKSAIKFRKECLTVHWVKDSVSKGYRLPYGNYRIREDYKKTLENILINIEKELFQGCKIWLCGFDNIDHDKLQNIFSIGGATEAARIDPHESNIEYAIVGKPDSAELCILKSLENSKIVTVEWLLACINAKRVVDAKDFVYRLETVDSNTIPNDRKLEKLTEGTEVEATASTHHSETDLLKVTNDAVGNTQASTASIQSDINVFQELHFALFGFSKAMASELQKIIARAGGLTNVDDYSNYVTYLVVSLNSFDFKDVRFKYSEMVNELYVQDCLTVNELVGISYYHRAIKLNKNSKPLHGANIHFSGFSDSSEGKYLSHLAMALGGVINENFSKNSILICQTVGGENYEKAIEWNLPVVSSEWLKICYELKEKVELIAFQRYPTVPVQTEIIDLCVDEPDELDQPAGAPTTNRKICLIRCAELQTLKRQIRGIRGTVCEELIFHKSCTHLISSKPTQNEKTTSVIASGGWLLCPAYIEDSFMAGRFLNEEDYEWGNPKAISKLPSDVDVSSNKIAMMSHKWRTALQLKSENENKSVGIFSGFRVILHSNRKDNFKRIIEAGCGVVVDIKEPYAKQPDFQGVTHCVVDRSMPEIAKSDMEAMRMAEIHCVTLLYIQACIQEDTMPSVKDYAAKCFY